MDTNNIDALISAIDKNEEILTLDEKKNLEYSLEMMENLLSIVNNLKNLKEVARNLHYNRQNLEYRWDSYNYDCNNFKNLRAIHAKINDEFETVYSMYYYLNCSYCGALQKDNIPIINIDFDSTIEKLNIAKSKLEKILENK